MPDEPTLVAPRSARRSPFHEATLRDGCRQYIQAAYTISHEVYYPLRLLDADVEYEKLTTASVLFDPPVERPVEIAGPDAAAYVDRLLTRDMTKCAVGRCRYAILCDREGRVLMDSVILRLEENRFWLSGDLGWIRGCAAGLGMAVDVDLAEASPLQIQGPTSRDVVHALFGEAVSGLKFYRLARVELDGMALVVTRTGWTGERGYEVYLTDFGRGVELWDRILEAGRPFGLTATGTSNVRRVEAGILDTSLEACPPHNPFELGLDRFVDFGKASPFIGREALARIAAEGVARKLVGYASGERFDAGREGLPPPAADGDAALWTEISRRSKSFPWPVTDGDAEIGYATCAVWSSALERTIGYAMVPPGRTAEGAPLTIATPDGPRPAAVHRVPFVDPAKTRMRGA